MRKFALLLFLVVFGGGVASAATTTLTFDNLPLGVLSEFAQDGYLISWHNYPNGTYAQEIINVGGSNQNAVVDSNDNGFGTALSIRRVDGSPFTVQSADIANLGNTASNDDLRFGVPETPGVGNGQFLSYYPSSSTFTTVDPSSLLNAVDEIYIDLILGSGTNHAVDNIVLTPEPSTSLLVSLGIIGMCLRRNRAF